MVVGTRVVVSRISNEMLYELGEAHGGEKKGND